MQAIRSHNVAVQNHRAPGHHFVLDQITNLTHPVTGMTIRFAVLLTGLLAVTMSGCSDQAETWLVHGMVVYPDGKPLKHGTVEFETTYDKKPITASAELGEDGTFQLGTYEKNDGAIAGLHRVAVISEFQIGTGIERPGKLPPPALHPKFGDFATSGLEFEVKPQKNNILIEVDYAPAPEQEETDAGSYEAPGE